jgi:ATP-dependent protease ClpP protease subunit
MTAEEALSYGLIDIVLYEETKKDAKKDAKEEKTEK